MAWTSSRPDKLIDRISDMVPWSRSCSECSEMDWPWGFASFACIWRVPNLGNSWTVSGNWKDARLSVLVFQVIGLEPSNFHQRMNICWFLARNLVYLLTYILVSAGKKKSKVHYLVRTRDNAPHSLSGVELFILVKIAPTMQCSGPYCLVDMCDTFSMWWVSFSRWTGRLWTKQLHAV